MMHNDPRPPAPGRLPAGIWVLGFVSLLMDVSSEMIHSLLPVFMSATLGLGMAAIGLIEGVAEATALLVKVFSGTLSDRMPRRKTLALAGYALSALTKPMFPLAAGAASIIAARFADRVGKGIRGAPRDALVADLAPPGMRGAAFGLRQSLDTVGAVLGPLLAIALMILWAGDVRAVFWVAVVPALLAVLLLLVGVREAVRPTVARAPWPVRRAALAALGAPCWRVVALGAVFTLARFSEAFLLLRAADLGLAIAWVPIVLVGMNLAYAVSAYPFGRLADRMDRDALLAIGLVLLIASDLVLARAGGLTGLAVGVTLWGVQMGATQGLLAAMVADAAPAHLRGTAFGVFNLCSGVAMLAASALAGALWQAFGAPAAFSAGAGFAALTLAGLGWVRRRGRTRPAQRR